MSLPPNSSHSEKTPTEHIDRTASPARISISLQIMHISGQKEVHLQNVLATWVLKPSLAEFLNKANLINKPTNWH